MPAHRPRKPSLSVLLAFLALAWATFGKAAEPAAAGFTNAADFGFLPEASGIENAKALQKAVDRAGTIVVSRPGIYKISGTVFIGSDTSLIFGAKVFLQKTVEKEPFTHVFLNKGALTKTWDERIVIDGLSIIVNGVDVRKFLVFGLHGHLSFFYARDIRINRFRCRDIGKWQYGIHVCTFEDLIIDDVIVSGDKDGIHLGRGKRFNIRNGVFRTYDDAIALNAHDYDVGNPELGWIEDGVVENCHDLDDHHQKKVGYFSRIIAGAWLDWRPGMEVQKSDTVVSNGRLYRVLADPDSKVYKSLTRPEHRQGEKVLDGIRWSMVQNDVTYNVGVRNVVFRNIFLHKPRHSFSMHADHDRYSRSFYPGVKAPVQAQLRFENIRVLHNREKAVVLVGTPADVIHISNSSLRNSSVFFHGNDSVADYGFTKVLLTGCTFNHPGTLGVVKNLVPGKRILLQTAFSNENAEGFSATVSPGPGTIDVDSDLIGLRK